jgi:hypothetical protein
LKIGERPGFVWHCHFSIQEIWSHEPPTQESGDVLPLTRLASCESFDPAVIVRYFHSHLSAGADHLVSGEVNPVDELMLCRSEQIQSDIDCLSSVMANQFLTSMRIDAIAETETRRTETTQDGLQLRYMIVKHAKWDKRKLRVVSTFCRIKTILIATKHILSSSGKSGLLIHSISHQRHYWNA